MQHIEIPSEWNDSALLTMEEFCALFRAPRSKVRHTQHRGAGPRFWRFNGTGRLYTTVAEVRAWNTPTSTISTVPGGEPGGTP